MVGKSADAADYEPWDLLVDTPLVVDGALETTSVGLVGVEFRADVLPLLETHCESCHTSVGGAAPANGAGMALFDTTITDPEERAVEAWWTLARDYTSDNAHGDAIPGQSSTSFHTPQKSRYVRALQARQSLLAWTIWGERLDGRSNDDLPGQLDVTNADIDFVRGPCPAPDLLSSVEKGTITRWIDLGGPMDLDRPEGNYTDDGLVPILTAGLVDVDGILSVRVGALDVESGLDLGSLRVDAVLADGSEFSLSADELVLEADSHVAWAVLDAPAADAFPARLWAEVRDRAGNLEDLERIVDGPDLGTEPPDPTEGSEEGTPGEDADGNDPAGDPGGGCGCRTPGPGGGVGWLLLALGAAAAPRRRSTS